MSRGKRNTKLFRPETMGIAAGLLEAAGVVEVVSGVALRAAGSELPPEARAGDVVGLSSARPFGMTLGAALLEAHAAELAMKVVLERSGRAEQAGNAMKEHHLGKLYEALGEDVKAHLQAGFTQLDNSRFDANMGRIGRWIPSNRRDDLAFRMRATGDVSVQVRYAPQGKLTRGVDRVAIRHVAASIMSLMTPDGRVEVPGGP